MSITLLHPEVKSKNEYAFKCKNEYAFKPGIYNIKRTIESTVLGRSQLQNLYGCRRMHTGVCVWVCFHIQPGTDNKRDNGSTVAITKKGPRLQVFTHLRGGGGGPYRAT